MKRTKASPRAPRSPAGNMRKAIEFIVDTTPPSRLLELYYWSQDPHLLRLIRSISALPDGSRNAVAMFFRHAEDLAAVKAHWSPKGVLTLTADKPAHPDHLVWAENDDDTEPGDAKAH